ncbi:MAG: DUF4956 domain-containing protein [Coprobacter sp.]|nr:DUF4956 domain-containing protein [Coprobacter sp.]
MEEEIYESTGYVVDAVGKNIDSLTFLGTPLIDVTDMWQLMLRFVINTFVIWCIVHFLYYRKSRRLDYYFTFSLISISIFFLIFLLGGVKLKIGLALGLFAIFGIIRYRTESMPVREMTYLFVIISISVINALAVTLSYAELLLTNLIFIASIWLFESNRGLKHLSCKLVMYDRIELIKPECYDQMVEDLRQRTGLTIIRVEVGSIDFLRDTAMLKVYYDSENVGVNSVDNVLKFPKGEV